MMCVRMVYFPSSTPIPSTVSTGRMTNQSAANQANTNKAKEKEENQRDDNTDVAYKDAGHCSRNTHSLLLGLTVGGKKGLGNSAAKAVVAVKIF